ncbi:MAG: Crp/Fnr family transcriptional regulator [Bacteroidota bacterium]|jgi:CRP-like cAMP-binding protein
MGELNCINCKEISCAALNLNRDELGQQISSGHGNSYKAGELILKEGTFSSNIIYLKSGLVKEFKIGKGHSEEYILQIVKEKSYLGLASLFGDRINHFSYTALTDVKVCNIDIAVFKAFIQENGNFGYHILQSVCSDSLNNYHRFTNLHFKKIYGKLADALLYFSKNIYMSNRFLMHLSRNEISFLIGSSRESVSKQLNQFEKEGIIKLKGKEITIIKPETLEKISKFG